MTRAGRGRGTGAARWRRGLAALVAAVLLTAVLAVAGGTAAGCGEPEVSQIGPMLGTWYRVQAGEPDPDLSLIIAEQAGGAAVTFTDATNGKSATVNGEVDDGAVFCTIPTGDTGAGPVPGASLASPEAGATISPEVSASASPSPDAGASSSPGAPVQVDIRLSIDETSGQLVVDLVLADGTLEPIWLYDRGESTVTP